MLVVFAALMSWRLTGVSIHEWAATGLLVVIVAHLLIHWHWIETRVAQLRGGSRRTKVNVLLNLSLFTTMGAALVSGFAISKVMFPNRFSSGDYLRWHSVHETSATLTLVILGLHIALNWDLVAGGIRRLRRRSATAVAPRAEAIPERERTIGVATLARRFAFILAGAFIIAVGTRAAASLVSPEKTVLIVWNGHVSRSAIPPGIGQIHNGDRTPDFGHGLPRYFVRLAMIGVVAYAGRRILKLRLA